VSRVVFALRRENDGENQNSRIREVTPVPWAKPEERTGFGQRWGSLGCSRVDPFIRARW